MAQAPVSALSSMQDLRDEIDARLSVVEDYRALRALDKAIVEIKLSGAMLHQAPPRRQPADSPVVERSRGPSNPVGETQFDLSKRIVQKFGSSSL